jgi:hypothetical protein
MTGDMNDDSEEEEKVPRYIPMSRSGMPIDDINNNDSDFDYEDESQPLHTSRP